VPLPSDDNRAGNRLHAHDDGGKRLLLLGSRFRADYQTNRCRQIPANHVWAWVLVFCAPTLHRPRHVGLLVLDPSVVAAQMNETVSGFPPDEGTDPPR
jgi:hypothetical protein